MCAIHQSTKLGLPLRLAVLHGRRSTWAASENAWELLHNTSNTGSLHIALSVRQWNNLLGLKRATMTAVNIINFKHGGNTNAAREVTMA